ncbi:hypothetical protein ACWEJ6_48315 [Nonomuraea sp. NPDC004702]
MKHRSVRIEEELVLAELIANLATRPAIS